MITFGSLFSGIGGIDLGLERAGMVCRFQVEIDDYATKVLAKHWPDVARFRDVRECGAHNLPAVDVLAGGFPCQPHSLAGKRAASADERDLWGEFARIIGEIKPQWIVAENVPGLLSSDDGRFFGNVLRDLAARGYDAEWQSLPAAAFGAPHIRDRVFILAYAQKQPAGAGLCAHKQSGQRRGRFGDGGGALVMAHAPQRRLEGRGIKNSLHRSPSSNRSSELAGSGAGIDAEWWATEPNVGRVADGIPARMDRLRGLGNAVVPQVAQFVGECIMAAETERAA